MLRTSWLLVCLLLPASALAAGDGWAGKCKSGEAKACLKLGQSYETRKGATPSDLKQAQAYYQRACQLKLGGGCYALGWLHRRHRLGKPAIDAVAARRYLQLACGLNDALGCFRLAREQLADVTAPKHPRTGLENLTRACKLGSGAACATLAQLHTFGLWVAINLAMAKSLFERALTLFRAQCGRKDAEGCYGGAVLLLKPLGRERDPGGARVLLNQALTLKKNDALCLLGSVEHLTPDGRYKPSEKGDRLQVRGCRLDVGDCCMRAGYAAAVAGKPLRALELFRKGCQLRDSNACNYAGMVYLAAPGVQRDARRALQLLELSCNLGNGLGCYNLALHGPKTARLERLKTGCRYQNGPACYELALAYDLGKGLAQDSVLARRYFVAACLEESGLACYHLARVAYSNPAHLGDKLRATKLLQRACALNVSVACYSFAVIRKSQNKLQDFVRSLEKACVLQHAKSCQLVARLYFNGQFGKPRSNVQGLRYLVRGCEYGLGEACYQAGALLADGTMVPKNLVDAARYLGKGCKLRETKACQELKKLKLPKP